MKNFILKKLATLLIIVMVTLFIGWAFSSVLGAIFIICAGFYWIIKAILDLIKLL